jgi:methionine-rich copper-binding protein CopC
MKPVVALALLLAALAAALAFPATPAYAQIEITEADPPDGAHLNAPPDVVHLCFSQPVNIEDNTAFRFRYQMPNGRSLGLRIVFQRDGECVDVDPGLPDEYPVGEYTFAWQVTAAEGDEVGSGTLRFQIGAGETPSPDGSQGTGDADDDGPDILFLALITTASVGGVAVLLTLGYLVRRRIGYEPHRPSEGGEEGEGH